MDFANLDLKRASERGTWVHLEFQGEPLSHDGNPCRVKVLGMAAPAVVAAFRKIERIELQRPASQSESQWDKHQRLLEEALLGLVVAGVGAWENIVYDGKPLDCEPENVALICGPGTLFFDQIRKAIVDEQRLFTNAATGS
jgi:hypothetical protein